MALQLWNPARQIDRFRHDIDSLFDQFFGEHAQTAPGKAPALEVFLEDDKLVVRADLPGLDPKNIDISLMGNVLTIKGSREQHREEKKRNFMYQEVTYGAFERRLPLPPGLKSDDIMASYKDGVLELTMPAPHEMTPRKVAIETETQKSEPAIKSA